MKFPSCLSTVCAFTIGMCSVVQGPLAHAQSLGVSTPDEAKTNPAFDNAERRLSTLESEIKDAQRNLDFQTPPVRTTDGKGVTTVDPNQQRRYEQDRQMWSKKVQNLRQEQLVWQLQVNQLLAMEAAQKNALQTAVVVPTPPPTVIYVPVPAPASTSVPAPGEAKANPALENAKRRLSTLESEIKDAQRNLDRQTPPVRTTDGKGVTTVDPNQQRRYEQDLQMWSKKVQNLRQEQLAWQLQVNQLLAMETAQKNAAQAASAVSSTPPTVIYLPVPAPAPTSVPTAASN